MRRVSRRRIITPVATSARATSRARSRFISPKRPASPAPLRGMPGGVTLDAVGVGAGGGFTGGGLGGGGGVPVGGGGAGVFVGVSVAPGGGGTVVSVGAGGTGVSVAPG